MHVCTKYCICLVELDEYRSDHVQTDYKLHVHFHTIIINFHNIIVTIDDHGGHIVSPYFRFLTKSGDWVWMQMEGITRYKKGTTTPEYYEYKARVLR